jgi:hypothetical protein
MFDFKQFLNGCIDSARLDLWTTDDVVSLNEPTDRHGHAERRQNARAQIWGAIMDYREGNLVYSDLVMFLQSFDPYVTVDDVDAVLGNGVNH